MPDTPMPYESGIPDHHDALVNAMKRDQVEIKRRMFEQQELLDGLAGEAELATKQLRMFVQRHQRLVEAAELAARYLADADDRDGDAFQALVEALGYDPAA